MAFVESTVRVEFPGSVSFVDGVRLKRRLPVIPRVRNGGVYVALAGNFSQEVTIHNSSRSFLDCVYLLDSYPSMGQVP